MTANLVSSALHNELLGDVNTAIDIYKRAVEANTVIPDAYINLACIYWLCNDYGFSTFYQIKQEVISVSFDEMFRILNLARQRIGYLAEVEFWHKYFTYTYIDDTPFLDVAMQLVSNDTTLVPYFYILCESKDESYLLFVKRLYQSIVNLQSMKNKYIIEHSLSCVSLMGLMNTFLSE